MSCALALRLRMTLEFVRAQLAKHFPDPPKVFPYSVRPGSEDLRDAFETSVLQTTLAAIQSERQAILHFNCVRLAGNARAIWNSR